MKKTLLLVFIHGFKGGDDTFGATGDFAEHLATLLSVELPKVNIRTLVYPKYETRGDLAECVSRFRDWLLEKVIDIEVAAGTPSPTIDPSVRTVLVGHSMGGIVAAETAIGLAGDKVIPAGGTTAAEDEGEEESGEDEKQKAVPDHSDEINSLMFPYIQGVLAFDTPYLGIAPGVVAHGAEGHYQNAAAIMSQLSGLSAIWGGSKAAESPPVGTKKPVAALEAPPKEESKAGIWNNWGKMAMYAGGAAAVAAGGAAAWVNRQQISEGWGWVGSHLEFVGCLARGEEMKKRVANMVRLNRELGVGFANLYTRLGKAADSKQVSTVGLVMGSQRTFCNLPSKMRAGEWKEAVNDAAKDETGAHMAMFESNQNPGYAKLSEDAVNMIVKWTKNDWYETSNLALEE
ncbi:hypothetical protein PFICI_11744 [Pestalotiopsis fici W106-1]|uniref:AB hydrolase-1 domain-containing protein n=1 Tax=Pestalotiopsis fici (strain W106-1 / CGMCC3.15140) TaxID=1229662 RepID=W3WT88_PESFW|nr:uncharacterized protein PFICI_11744 [Pestalotiopsis fici W106-1]ETS76357.1 hypothetical protein PFICI_11744 [Pestalotiopsis fici W106-1]